jgi:hypothetical protein
MKDFILTNMDKIIAVFCILEFEFVLVYRRRYLKEDSRINLIFMLLTIVLFTDSFFFTIRSFSTTGLPAVVGLVRIFIHAVFTPFLIGFYLYKKKAAN